MASKPEHYNLFWRWHFYAGLIVTPIMLVLAITGGLYLLQPQIEGWLYKDMLTLKAPHQGKVDHDSLINSTKLAFAAQKLHSYQPPLSPQHSAQLVLTSGAGEKLTAFVHPQTFEVLGTVGEKWRLMNVAREIHRGLLLGTPGRVITELAACWVIVMIITGLYLWWPRGNKKRGAAIPNTKSKGRKLWREFHAVPGAWVSLWILALLFTGLPWSILWGEILDRGAHTVNEGFPKAVFDARPVSTSPAFLREVSMNDLINIAADKGVPPCYKIDYPWGEKGSYALLPLRHDCKNLEENVYLFFDRRDGHILEEYHWQDLGKVGRFTTLGVAFHEGRLFGLANQIINLLAVLVLITIGITGPVMWLKRKPKGYIGAPAVSENLRLSKPLLGLIILTGILLPLFGLSVLIIWLGELAAAKLRGKRATT